MDVSLKKHTTVVAPKQEIVKHRTVIIQKLGKSGKNNCLCSLCVDIQLHCLTNMVFF